MSSNSEQNCEVQLAAEIEVLKSALADKHSQLLAMESACLQESDRQVELEDSIIAWQDKYERLYESHKRVQKLNQNLEDKLLKLVDRNSGERAQLTSDVATLSVRLAQANYNIQSLKREIVKPVASLLAAMAAWNRIGSGQSITEHGRTHWSKLLPRFTGDAPGWPKCFAG
uniref:Uncharacterized protein n=1 Tax=Anopheles culicifacies TaxID=139723 RepID=A0A182MD58_9DIPT